MTIEELILEIIAEYKRASSKFPAFHSAHEGYAIILEELDELKSDIWINSNKRNYQHMKEEAIQVAAMAIRFLIDVIPENIK